jgi:hypothetical protein
VRGGTGKEATSISGSRTTACQPRWAGDDDYDDEEDEEDEEEEEEEEEEVEEVEEVVVESLTQALEWPQNKERLFLR